MSERFVPAAGRTWLTPVYDAGTGVAMRQGRWRPLLVQRAVGARTAPRILDLGCGTAAMALAIGRRHPGAEIRRVLVPGGRLLVADPGRAQDPVMRLAFLAVQLLDGFSNTRENAAGNLPDVIAQAGFSAVSLLGR